MKSAQGSRQSINYRGMMKEKFWKPSQLNGFLKGVRDKYITDQMGRSFKSKGRPYLASKPNGTTSRKGFAIYAASKVDLLRERCRIQSPGLFCNDTIESIWFSSEVGWLNIFIQDDHFSYRNCYQHGSCVHNTKDSHKRGFFNVPQNYQHSRNCETGPPAYRPYPRRLESLTICR